MELHLLSPAESPLSQPFTKKSKYEWEMSPSTQGQLRWGPPLRLPGAPDLVLPTGHT